MGFTWTSKITANIMHQFICFKFLKACLVDLYIVPYYHLQPWRKNWLARIMCSKAALRNIYTAFKADWKKSNDGNLSSSWIWICDLQNTQSVTFVIKQHFWETENSDLIKVFEPTCPFILQKQAAGDNSFVSGCISKHLV